MYRCMIQVSAEYFYNWHQSGTGTRGGYRILERGGGSNLLGLYAKRGIQGGPALVSMLKSLHRGPKVGGVGVQTPWALSGPATGYSSKSTSLALIILKQDPIGVIRLSCISRYRWKATQGERDSCKSSLTTFYLWFVQIRSILDHFQDTAQLIYG